MVRQLLSFPCQDYWIPVSLADTALDEEGLLDFGGLPQYRLCGIADAWDGEQQAAALLLVYEAKTDAEMAAQELHSRFSADISSASETLSENGELQTGTTFDSDSGRSVALITITYPTPPLEAENAEDAVANSSAKVYTTLWMMLMIQEMPVYLASEIQP
jgi:hypothetical protein